LLEPAWAGTLLVESVVERGFAKPAAAAESSHLNRPIDASSWLYWTFVFAVAMVLKGTTKLVMSRTKTKDRRGKIREYERFLIHIPSAMARDSQFPFKPRQQLTITVDPKGKMVLRA